MIERISFIPGKPVSGAADSLSRPGAAQVADQFGSFLNNAMKQLNSQEHQVDVQNEKFIAGELSDVHSLTIAAEKLALGLELTVQVRNKAIEAYQEIMRTQI